MSLRIHALRYEVAAFHAHDERREAENVRVEADGLDAFTVGKPFAHGVRQRGEQGWDVFRRAMRRGERGRASMGYRREKDPNYERKSDPRDAAEWPPAHTAGQLSPAR